MNNYKNRLRLIVSFFSILIIFIGCQSSSSDDPASVPTQNAVSVSFTDTDLDEDQLAGTVTITKATDESSVTEYHLYWGSSATEKLAGQSIIAALTADGSDPTHVFAVDTAVPTNTTHLLIYTANTGGEAVSPTSVDIPDLVMVMVADINSGSGSSAPSSFLEFGSKLYFSATNPTYGREIWVYDGTNSPSLLMDINSGTGDSNDTSGGGSMQPIVFNGKLHFSADNGTSGKELWVYDGITEPVMLKDIFNGAGSSSPANLAVVNNRLYFSADDGTNGTELWVFYEK